MTAQDEMTKHDEMTAPFEMILASRSPRRAAILARMGFRFSVRVRSVDETIRSHDPEPYVLELSVRKAAAVRSDCTGALIIGADTVVFHNGRILGKPSGPEEAAAMLRGLSGATHQVYTGFALLHPDGRAVQDCVVTDVTFRALADWEIRRYVVTGEPLDKAGAYGIQGGAGVFVDRIDGCYYNVVGFPVARFHEKLSGLVGEDTVRRLMEDPSGRYG